ncbi:hypothetical protein QAD02_003883 [Eretmocerus hayati]|uniref:Uncharacterized protein n=1 Tax=Eretmocerus hayati TaxID=131215 RepID=A0ACC2NMY3_9HYME|nr:hypothetical protein QAD02_003883 [Eretmocerus hayati]
MSSNDEFDDSSSWESVSDNADEQNEANDVDSSNESGSDESSGSSASESTSDEDDDSEDEEERSAYNDALRSDPEFWEAILDNELDSMKRFIDKGFDVNKYNELCLFFTVAAGNLDMTKILIDAGAKLDIVNKHKTGVMNRAIQGIEDTNKRFAMVKLLIHSGYNVKNDAHLRLSHVHDAVCREDVELIKFLANAGASVDRINSDGDTPLLIALKYNFEPDVSLNLAKCLIELGADVNIKDKKGLTCLHWSAMLDSNAVEATRMLLEAGAQVNCISNDGSTPLARAASSNDRDLIKLMIDAGADVNFTKTLDNSALMCAVVGSHSDAVELLLQSGADLEIEGPDGKYDIFACAAFRITKKNDDGYIEILKLFLNHDAYKRRSKHEKSMVFRDILRGGILKAVNLFIENGTKLEDCGVRFPLHAAACNSNAEVLEFLLKTYLFDIDELDKDGCSSLFTACSQKNSACVKLLLEWGADVELPMTIPQINVVMSPLCATVLKKNQKILDLLLSAGAKPNPNAGNDDDSEFYVDTRKKNPINSCLHAQSILFASYLGWVKMDPDYKWFRMTYCSEATDKCLAELEVLKTHVLYGSVTLYDFLKGDDVTGFICNNDVIDKFNSMNVVESFPIYGRQLSLCHSMACIKKVVMDEAVEGLNRILGGCFRDHYLILRHIMLQLKMRDLRNLCNI